MTNSEHLLTQREYWTWCFCNTERGAETTCYGEFTVNSSWPRGGRQGGWGSWREMPLQLCLWTHPGVQDAQSSCWQQCPQTCGWSQCGQRPVCEPGHSAPLWFVRGCLSLKHSGCHSETLSLVPAVDWEQVSHSQPGWGTSLVMHRWTCAAAPSAALSSLVLWKVTLPGRQVGTELILMFPSNPNCSRILRFCDFYQTGLSWDH